MSFVSGGFHGVGAARTLTRCVVPPGQYVTDDFPVLSASPTPHTPLEEWTFTIRGAVRTRARWKYGLVAERCSSGQFVAA
jgi:hypothetical protein